QKLWGVWDPATRDISQTYDCLTRGGLMTKAASPFGEVIYGYSRADAIRDGVLIAVNPATCKEAGVILPVAVTDNLWGYVEPGNLAEMPGQSVEGRLWDLLWMFRMSLNSRTRHGDTSRFQILFLTKSERQRPRLEEVTVIGRCGPGDDAEPVITLMLPGDD
ncbi:MAG: hypothetical protein LUQ07_00595, partial [Methanospirillum sp.]|nr:hypothetical protein [Methanospirillum sp.]